MYVPFFKNLNKKKSVVQENAKKLKKIREDNGLETAPKKINLCACPWCKQQTCYYVGFDSLSIDCLNPDCKFFKPIDENGEDDGKEE